MLYKEILQGLENEIERGEEQKTDQNITTSISDENVIVAIFLLKRSSFVRLRIYLLSA